MAIYNKNGTGFAMKVHKKGRKDRIAIKRIADYLKASGFTGDLVLQTEGEPAITALAEEISGKRMAKTFVRRNPVGSHVSMARSSGAFRASRARLGRRRWRLASATTRRCWQSRAGRRGPSSTQPS